jgi:hypothetical protein
MKRQIDTDPAAGSEPEDSPDYTASPERSQRIRWQNYDQIQYFVGRIGPAKFEISSGVGGMFGAMFSFAGDCYAVLSTAKTVGEAKRFCEWVARGYGLDTNS